MESLAPVISHRNQTRDGYEFHDSEDEMEDLMQQVKTAELED